MAVYKAEYTITVLAEFDTPAEAEQAFVNIENFDLLCQIDQGDWIGTQNVNVIGQIQPEHVEKELLEMGNDGTFFNNGE